MKRTGSFVLRQALDGRTLVKQYNQVPSLKYCTLPRGTISPNRGVSTNAIKSRFYNQTLHKSVNLSTLNSYRSYGTSATKTPDTSRSRSEPDARPTSKKTFNRDTFMADVEKKFPKTDSAFKNEMRQAFPGRTQTVGTQIFKSHTHGVDIKYNDRFVAHVLTGRYLDTSPKDGKISSTLNDPNYISPKAFIALADALARHGALIPTASTDGRSHVIAARVIVGGNTQIINLAVLNPAREGQEPSYYIAKSLYPAGQDRTNHIETYLQDHNITLQTLTIDERTNTWHPVPPRDSVS